MDASEKKILEGFLSKTLKIDTEDLASLYNEAGELVDLSVAEKVDADRVKKLKSENTDQYKRGVKEGAQKIEKAVREKYAADSDLEGVELIDFVITDKIAEAKGTSEDITKHPEFLKHQHEWDKQLKAKDKELQLKIEEKEREFNKKSVLTKIEKRALDALDQMRPILPEDAKKAQRWKDKYLEEFRAYDYQEKDGDFIMLKEGEPVKDSHGHMVTFDDFARDTAAGYFDFQAAADRSSPGNKNIPDKPPIKPPTSDDELYQRMKAAKTPEERIAIKESYEKNKQK